MAKSKAARRSAREERLAAIRAQQRRADRRRKFVAGVVVVAIVAAVGGILAALQSSGGSGTSATAFSGPLGGFNVPIEQGTPLAPPNPQLTGQTVDGITCGAEQLKYHIHTHLGIFVNGQLKPVPLGVGIVGLVTQGSGAQQVGGASKCYYWLHTHAQDGVIHVESPTTKIYTLGNFFDLWGQPLSASQIGPAKGAVTAYVNGKEYSGDPRSIPLSPHGLIQLEIGKPTVPPKTVDWSKTQL